MYLLSTQAEVTLRTRKFITNRLLARRQFVLDILHPSRPNVSKAELSSKLGALYKADEKRVVTFGLRTHFGGGRTTGFALIYDDEASQKKFEPKYRLVRVSPSTVTRTRRFFINVISVVWPHRQKRQAFEETKKGEEEQVKEGSGNQEEDCRRASEEEVGL